MVFGKLYDDVLLILLLLAHSPLSPRCPPHPTPPCSFSSLTPLLLLPVYHLDNRHQTPTGTDACLHAGIERRRRRTFGMSITEERSSSGGVGVGGEGGGGGGGGGRGEENEQGGIG